MGSFVWWIVVDFSTRNYPQKLSMAMKNYKYNTSLSSSIDEVVLVAQRWNPVVPFLRHRRLNTFRYKYDITMDSFRDSWLEPSFSQVLSTTCRRNGYQATITKQNKKTKNNKTTKKPDKYETKLKKNSSIFAPFLVYLCNAYVSKFIFRWLKEQHKIHILANFRTPIQQEYIPVGAYRSLVDRIP